MISLCDPGHPENCSINFKLRYQPASPSQVLRLRCVSTSPTITTLILLNRLRREKEDNEEKEEKDKVKEMLEVGERESTAFKVTCYCCRGLDANSHSPHGSSQPSLNPVLFDWIPSSGLFHACMWCAHIYAGRHT